MDQVFPFASTEARLFGLKHMADRATKTDLNKLVKAVGPTTTTCLLCGHDATTQWSYCSNLTGAAVALRTGRRCGRLLSAVASEVRVLCLGYYEELFAGAVECEDVHVRHSEREPNILHLHWQGGLFEEIGIAAAERLAPTFRIRGYRRPGVADALRAAHHIESLLAGSSIPLGLMPAQAAGSSRRCPQFSEIDTQPWFNFELGECGTLHECFRHLCNGESTVLPAISEEDISRGLAHTDAGVRAFSWDLLRTLPGPSAAGIAPSLPI